ncbi:inactive poly [ADP-ribose] polymerase RCD1-like isoform X2 [Punica granatum]|uniref:Inactive poly [ADP-ribose] polymerase RCD1-like isoform X2 n=1 Tax=Punica granatum TaxID=22663 RepID=A0A6P8BUQ8_PUNGR|nr:inactive poly [ADP-ribose] polymerase RCD1-like isoform X2 [Punica granatum]
MEFRIAKALDSASNQGILLKAKKKRAAHAAFTGNAARAALGMCNLPAKKVGKRRKLNGFNGESARCGCIFQKSIARYYSNFIRTGIPQRLMFYQNGEWTDFPQSLVGMIKKDFQMKKAAIEVELNGYSILLDFLHMFRVDLKTGSQQPIAWIDEAGSCFFPEIFADDSCHHQFGRHEDHLYRDSSGPRELKLQLEIDINGVDLRECSGESNTLEENIQNDLKPAGNQMTVAVEDACYRVPDQKRADTVGVNEQMEANLVPVVNPVEEELDPDFVQKMFLVNITSFGSVDIVDSQSCSSALGQARFELFHKQAEITKKHRGDANIQYAWLAITSEALSSVMTYGIGSCGALTNKSIYGTGVHLTSANYPNISAKYCDVDEKGIRHMVYCRVIMGNMEHVHRGSKQFHPSSEEFDSGVDDLQNPTHYVVWTMNVNTHIYPEFVISFKLQLDVKECATYVMGHPSDGTWEISLMVRNQLLSLIPPIPM